MYKCSICQIYRRFNIYKKADCQFRFLTISFRFNYSTSVYAMKYKKSWYDFFDHKDNVVQLALAK